MTGDQAPRRPRPPWAELGEDLGEARLRGLRSRGPVLGVAAARAPAASGEEPEVGEQLGDAPRRSAPRRRTRAARRDSPPRAARRSTRDDEQAATLLERPLAVMSAPLLIPASTTIVASARPLMTRLRWGNVFCDGGCVGHSSEMTAPPVATISRASRDGRAGTADRGRTRGLRPSAASAETAAACAAPSIPTARPDTTTAPARATTAAIRAANEAGRARSVAGSRRSRRVRRRERAGRRGPGGPAAAARSLGAGPGRPGRRGSRSAARWRGARRDEPPAPRPTATIPSPTRAGPGVGHPPRRRPGRSAPLRRTVRRQRGSPGRSRTPRAAPRTGRPEAVHGEQDRPGLGLVRTRRRRWHRGARRTAVRDPDAIAVAGGTLSSLRERRGATPASGTARPRRGGPARRVAPARSAIVRATRSTRSVPRPESARDRPARRPGRSPPASGRTPRAARGPTDGR